MPQTLIARKGTLLIVSGPRHDPKRKHLHVVCTDPDEAGNVVLVPICSVPAGPHDTTCLLQHHEHVFLTKPSFIKYAHAEIYKAEALATGVRRKIILPDKDLNGQSFLKVVAGICRSPLTPRKIKRYLNCTGK
jgi:hypothetical protein